MTRRSNRSEVCGAVIQIFVQHGPEDIIENLEAAVQVTANEDRSWLCIEPGSQNRELCKQITTSLSTCALETARPKMSIQNCEWLVS